MAVGATLRRRPGRMGIAIPYPLPPGGFVAPVGACRLCLWRSRAAASCSRLHHPRAGGDECCAPTQSHLGRTNRRTVDRTAVHRGEPRLRGVRGQRPLRASRTAPWRWHGPFPPALLLFPDRAVDLSHQALWARPQPLHPLHPLRAGLRPRWKGAHVWDVALGGESTAGSSPGSSSPGERGMPATDCGKCVMVCPSPAPSFPKRRHGEEKHEDPASCRPACGPSGAPRAPP